MSINLGGLKIQYNSHDLMVGHAHGMAHKDMIVLHETVSPDIQGLADIVGVEEYLAKVGYGIHGMTDKETNLAWAYGLGNAVFWHCMGGWTNSRACGIENVSNIPSAVEAGRFSESALAAAHKAWLARDQQLDAIAKLCAAIIRTHPDIPAVVSAGKNPGITTHYNVTHAFGIIGGHWDCWPVNNGGYFPLVDVVNEVSSYVKKGF